MLNTSVITVKLESGESEIFISPLLLQSKERPNLKSGKIEILYFYSQMQDDEYKALLEKEALAEDFKSSDYIINCGQDFEKYYLGSLHIDVDSKSYSQWEHGSQKLSEQDIKVLADSLFNPQSQSRSVTMFTPTRPSDINLGGHSKLNYNL
jgi:hypothetical protein